MSEPVELDDDRACIAWVERELLTRRVAALRKCTMLPGCSHKRFVRDIAAQLAIGKVELTAKQQLHVLRMLAPRASTASPATPSRASTRSRWANVMLLHAATQNGLDAGAERFRFFCRDDVLDTRKLAAKCAAVTTHVERQWMRETGAPE